MKKILHKILNKALIFCLIPYIMEGGFHFLPLTSDHLSDTYTTFCVGLFGLWVALASGLNLLKNYIVKFTTCYIIILYFTWTFLTFILNTTLGFNNWSVDSIMIYIAVGASAYAALYIGDTAAFKRVWSFILKKVDNI
jgi:hypothetical protein